MNSNQNYYKPIQPQHPISITIGYGKISYRVNSRQGNLSQRESEVIKLILQGYSAKKIGLVLAISNRTVETYIKNIKLKLGCHTKSELIEICYRAGLFQFL